MKAAVGCSDSATVRLRNDNSREVVKTHLAILFSVLFKEFPSRFRVYS